MLRPSIAPTDTHCLFLTHPARSASTHADKPVCLNTSETQPFVVGAEAILHLHLVFFIRHSNSFCQSMMACTFGRAIDEKFPQSCPPEAIRMLTVHILEPLAVPITEL